MVNRVCVREPCTWTEGRLWSKHVDVLDAVATAKIVAGESFNHPAILKVVPARIPTAEARIDKSAKNKTLKNVHYAKYLTKVAMISDFICNFATSIRFSHGFFIAQN